MSPPPPIVSVATLQAMLGQTDVVIVDCRFQLGDTEAGRSAFQQSRIPGAIYAHLDEDLCGPPATDHGRHPLPATELMIDRLGSMGIDSSKYVVAYDDRKNMMAARLWWMLNYLGHENVSVLDGGWDAWTRADAPIETQAPTRAKPTQFSGTPRSDWLVVLDQVDAQPKMIDSRAPERYRGDVEPLDPVGGHIPNAVNFHYAQCLDDQGCFLPVDEIRSKLQTSVFHDQAPEGATFYCGSGVSACVNLIAAKHAGFSMSKLYVGSWSEWSRKRLPEGQ